MVEKRRRLRDFDERGRKPREQEIRIAALASERISANLAKRRNRRPARCSSFQSLLDTSPPLVQAHPVLEEGRACARRVRPVDSPPFWRRWHSPYNRPRG